jgi:hypothetical protein
MREPPRRTLDRRDALPAAQNARSMLELSWFFKTVPPRHWRPCVQSIAAPGYEAEVHTDLRRECRL